jgi:hypothetical protein
MPSLYRVPKSYCPAMLACLLAVLGHDPARANETGINPFEVVSRSIVQDQGDWQVDYRLRHVGPSGLTASAEDVSVHIEGWVSNSRVPGHAVSRKSSATTSSPTGLQGVADVISSDDEEQRCRERVSVRIWGEDAAGNAAGRPLSSEPERESHGNGNGNSQGQGAGREDAEASPPTLSLAPGMTFRLRLRLEHRHVVYGTYDPLLGLRPLEIAIGAVRLSDVLPLDHEQHVAQPARNAFDTPDDRRNTQYFLSAPDSLHLAAHIPGNAFFRFPEVPIRYGTKMRLRFSYLIAAGTEGTCRARITQYKDSPIAWKVLADGRREELLSTVGRWTQVEIILRTELDATTLALDFRIEGADVEAGELWIDDVSLEPIGVSRIDP